VTGLQYYLNFPNSLRTVPDRDSQVEEKCLFMAQLEEGQPAWLNAIALLISLLAAAVIFLPFAFNTSPWDAVTLRVPGNQGNWWHALVGAPFFLALPMIWLRSQSLFSKQLPTSTGQRFIWIVAGLSICGTILVEVPFLLHLAGTSEWQRLAVLSFGFGIIIASIALLSARWRAMSPSRTCVVALNTAYLANAALCLIVYSGATGSLRSKSGWVVTMILVWPMALELGWVFIGTLRATNLTTGE
jgi:hypothetical protein